jgi:hypothetical protein
MSPARTIKGDPKMQMPDLFSYLGYEKDSRSKQYIALDQQISTFFKHYAAREGPVVHSWTSKSTEMDICAAEFLGEDDRGESFWPRQSEHRPFSESKLEWPRDQKQSVNILFIKHSC